jgi:uncharacterized protein YjbI with pentapeptide repeats
MVQGGSDWIGEAEPLTVRLRASEDRGQPVVGGSHMGEDRRMHVTTDPRVTRRRRWLALPLVGLLWLVAGVAAPVGAATLYRDCTGLHFAAGADLHRCDLADSTVIGMDLHGINLARSNISRINAGCDPDFPQTNLVGALIYRAIAISAKLCDAILIGADLHGTDFTNAAFEDANLNRANLSWATLDGANAGFAPIVNANLSNSSWVSANAPGATFDGSDLHRIDFRNGDLRSTSFVGSDLRYARLDRVDFTNADLTGALFNSSTTFVGVIWSNTTCRDGSNSDANGGTCVGH